MFESRYARKIAYLIAITFLIRCFLACCVNLGNDEAYYFTYALQPDWNHFDHPPLVGIFIRIFTLNLHWVNDLTMRFTAIVAAALGTWLIFKCGSLLKSESAGWAAAVLYNISLYTSIISGLFILPDSPQLVFWLLTLYMALKLLLSTDTRRQENTRLILIGVFIGIATMCKVHGLFLWFGIGFYMLLYDRKYFKNPFLYLSFVLTIVIISPIFFWNLQNNFITWRFHSERVEIHHALLNPKSFLTALGGQIMYNNPVSIIIYVIALARLKKAHFPKRTLSLLYWLSFPIIVVVTGISLFKDVLPHWSGPGFIGLMLIAAVVWDERLSTEKAPFYKRWLNAGTACIIIATILGIGCIDFYPGTLGNQSPKKLGAGDVTLDMYGWKTFSKEFRAIRQNDIRRGLTQTTTPIIINKWFPGNHILYYVGYPLHTPVTGVGSLLDLHKFAWLNRKEGYLKKGDNAYYITSSNYFNDPNAKYAGKFKKIILIKKISQKRSKKVACYWYVYKLVSALKPLGHILPE